MLSLEHNFLFLHLPRTGGNSVQTALAPFSEDEIVAEKPGQDGKDRFQVRRAGSALGKHASLKDYLDHSPGLNPDQLFLFTCVRDPWARCASHFAWRMRRKGETRFDSDAFAAFIGEAPRLHEQIALPGERFEQALSRLDLVMRHERLNEDFAAAARRIGLGDLALPHINRGPGGDYRDWYDTTARDRAAERFGDEIEAFGYAFQREL